MRRNIASVKFSTEGSKKKKKKEKKRRFFKRRWLINMRNGVPRCGVGEIATLSVGPDRSRPRKLQIDSVKGAHTTIRINHCFKVLPWNRSSRMICNSTFRMSTLQSNPLRRPGIKFQARTKPRVFSLKFGYSISRGYTAQFCIPSPFLSFYRKKKKNGVPFRIIFLCFLNLSLA